MYKDKDVIVPIEKFRQPVIHRLQKNTGKIIVLEQYLLMDSSKIRRLLGVKAQPPIKIRRGDPGPLYEVLSVEYKRWCRALVTGILNKHSESIKGI